MRKETMTAVRLHEPGGAGGLRVEEVGTPAPGPSEALVRVHAAALTRDELEWPVDRLPAIPSYELSGVVAELGSGANGVAVGAEVFALAPFDRDGAAAEYAVVPAGLLAPKPATLDHIASATVPLPALSAWQGLFEHGRLEAGQRVLIHGAAGGVGQFATQLARSRGAHVIGTASAAGLEAARELGAHEVLDRAARFEDGLEPVDLVFDTAGGETLARSSSLVRDGGRLVSVAEEPLPGDGRIDTVYFVVEPNREQLAELVGLVDRGELPTALDSVYPLAQAAEAFARVQEKGKRGKVVLRVVDD